MGAEKRGCVRAALAVKRGCVEPLVNSAHSIRCGFSPGGVQAPMWHTRAHSRTLDALKTRRRSVPIASQSVARDQRKLQHSARPPIGLRLPSKGCASACAIASTTRRRLSLSQPQPSADAAPAARPIESSPLTPRVEPRCGPPGARDRAGEEAHRAATTGNTTHSHASCCVARWWWRPFARPVMPRSSISSSARV